MKPLETLLKKDVIIKATDLYVRAVNVHYPPSDKTRYILTKDQLDNLLQNLYLLYKGKTDFHPLELMF